VKREGRKGRATGLKGGRGECTPEFQERGENLSPFREVKGFKGKKKNTTEG